MIKHFLTSLGTKKVYAPIRGFRPSSSGYYYDDAPYQDAFNGSNGPYFLLSLKYDGPYEDTFDGNHVKIICDGEVAFETSSAIKDNDETRYIGRDGQWAPMFWARESLVVQTKPRWASQQGTIYLTIMEFSE
jgi:hypothetical protein